ncbi:hydroxymethylglutaryl-CoA synthase [Desulfallas thermosapovorans]|uniref:Hydroxymethylglutaryl-CoA synthase n=1 Tax=Desulfallas thermosapovorans DSM 6562 TaxID=1121431 RepID=A0A5S4ZTZ6_9FIRM|nr:hydroxymethylglutaryl-CoA synthase [Desulfallas thermosapovorans]TYO96166.1 hydroxymethylglutaryl-CoA synthase [Desulfallas thermosapovorans DSM 6562]
MSKSIISYGVYLPYLRIKRDEFLSALGSCSAAMKEKTVMDIDEDVTTMAVEAARNALAGLDISRVGVLTLASTNFPYQEKEMAGTMVEALGLSNNVLSAQHANSTMSGTQAILSALGLMDQNDQPYALVVVSDAPTSAAHVDLENGFGAGACAFVLAKDEPGLAYEGVFGYSTEAMGLRYRLPGETDMRDIGVKAYATQDYNETVKAAVSGLMEKTGRKLADYNHVILHQSDAKTAAALAKKMGCTEEQTKGGQVFAQLGDTGAGAPLLALCRVLDVAANGDHILVCSYGSGSGSQALSFKLEKSLVAQTNKPMQAALEYKKYISYVQYLKLKRSI